MKCLLLLLILAAAVGAQTFPEKLPANYEGDKLADILALTGERGANLKKGEFETSIAWQKRVEALLETRINGHRLSTSVVVIKPRCTYDADRTLYECSGINGFEELRNPGGFSQYLVTDLKGPIRGSWKMNIADAQAAKGGIRMAVIGEPLLPHQRMADLTIRPLQVAFFDHASGTIYKVISLAGPESRPGPVINIQ